MSLQLHNISKSFGQLSILTNLNMNLNADTIYCLMSPSGSGKTTLLRLILELEQPDCGIIMKPEHCRTAAVFQENRLCESFSPLENVMMVTEKKLSEQFVGNELCRLLPEESITRPVSTLSGGMKRRTAICRALLAPSDLIVMDEPFTGLDEETKLRVIEYIKEKSSGKLLIITTHQEEDIDLLGGTLLTLTP